MDTEKKGIYLRIVSGLFFTGMALCVKALADTIPLGQIVFFRSLFAFPPLLFFLWACGEFPSGLKTTRPLGHALRSGLGAAAMFTSFATLKYLLVAEATMLSYLSPVMMVVLATALLDEKASISRWIGVCIGLGGVAVLTLPEVRSGMSENRLVGVLLGLSTAFLTAAALIQVRRLSDTEHAGVIAFYFALASMVAGAMTAPLGWTVPGLDEWLLLVGAGLFGGLGHIAMTRAFRMAEASSLAPFEYFPLIWATAAGAILFDEIPTMMFLLACIFIIGGAVLSTRSLSQTMSAKH